jgi:hypothetical protein
MKKAAPISGGGFFVEGPLLLRKRGRRDRKTTGQRFFFLPKYQGPPRYPDQNRPSSTRGEVSRPLLLFLLQLHTSSISLDAPQRGQVTISGLNMMVYLLVIFARRAMKKGYEAILHSLIVTDSKDSNREPSSPFVPFSS